MNDKLLRTGYFKIRNCTAIFLVCAISSFKCAGPPSANQPNIVLMFVDDLGYGDLEVYGAEGIRTPHLDKMAAEGIRLTDFYVSSPVCSASRASLLTGSYHPRVGIHGALNPISEIGLDGDETTLAELVRQAGYATAMVGKWHLGHHPEFLPTNHGFDRYVGIPYSNDMSPDPKNNPRERARRWPPLPLVRDLETIETEPDQSQLIRRYTAEALEFMRSNRDRPFFLYYAHTMPHVPLYISQTFAGSSERGLYGDVIQEIDGSVGEIVSALKESGIAENTLFIFTSDNGPWRVFGNHGGSCGPLRGRKGSVWECGVRVPFIAKWPGRIRAGVVSDTPAMTIDLLPTIAGITGTRLPVHKIDGRDVWPLLTGNIEGADPHDALYFYYGRQLQAMRAGRWKLHFPHTYRLVDQPGADGMPGTYVYPSTRLELYDLQNDLAESQDVAAEFPEVVARLSAKADSVRQELGDGVAEIEGSGVRPANRHTR